ncbi:hypothetical protein CMV60_02160 [Serratia marcescens]|nr:hypothetical protein CMV60_02160 [Serratia marcescens]
MLFRDRTLHRTAFDYSAKGLTLRASVKALFNAAQAPVVRVRSPYLENPPMAGFLLFRDRTLHRTAFDYSAKGLTLRASVKALFNTAPASDIERMFPCYLAPSPPPQKRWLQGTRITAFSALGVKVTVPGEQYLMSLRRILTLW